MRFSAQAIQEKFNLRIQDFGDGKRLLDNREYFQRKARDLMRRGIIPVENGFGGWLGEYEAALRQAASAIQNKTSEERENHLPRERGR